MPNPHEDSGNRDYHQGISHPSPYHNRPGLTTAPFDNGAPMKAIVLAAALSLCGTLALAQPVQYLSSDNINNTPVSAATPLPVTVASQTGTSASQVQGSSASAAADDGSKPVKIGCVANVGGFVTVVTNGQRSDAICSNHGSLGVGMEGGGGIVGMTSASSSLGSSSGQAQLAVEETGRPFANITTATTTTVKSGAGYLHSLTVNTYVASATITIYDNTAASGTKIATVTLPSTITGLAPMTVTYDARFATGLTFVTSGATDITVSYR